MRKVMSEEINCGAAILEAIRHLGGAALPDDIASFVMREYKRRWSHNTIRTTLYQNYRVLGLQKNEHGGKFFLEAAGPPESREAPPSMPNGHVRPDQEEGVSAESLEDLIERIRRRLQGAAEHAQEPDVAQKAKHLLGEAVALLENKKNNSVQEIQLANELLSKLQAQIKSLQEQVYVQQPAVAVPPSPGGCIGATEADEPCRVTLGINDLARKNDEAVHDALSFFEKQCPYCGRNMFHAGLRKKPEIDHFIPVVKGGQDLPWNLLPSCQECNRKKRDKMPYEFLSSEVYERCNTYLMSVQERYYGVGIQSYIDSRSIEKLIREHYEFFERHCDQPFLVELVQQVCPDLMAQLRIQVWQESVQAPSHLDDLNLWCKRLAMSPDLILGEGDSRHQRDLYTSKELIGIYDPEKKTNVTANSMGRALTNVGIRQVFKGRSLRLPDGSQTRFYAIRNNEHWLAASPRAIINHVTKDVGTHAD
jgi:hypothetical protein